MKKSLANPVPNLDELIQNGDENEDECDVENAGFLFCDGRQEEKVFSEDKAFCDVS
jgi:hypothetical protein